LIDVELVKLVPTWRNRRRGRNGISKRLDRFWVVEQLNKYLKRVRSWVCQRGMSYDLPILLQFELKCEKTHAPFKFNYSWLNEKDFKS